MRTEKRVILSDDPHNRVEDDLMQFRLTYEGQIFSSQPSDQRNAQRRDRRRDHKHAIRKRLHYQLRRLWEVVPFLNTGESSGPGLEGYVETTMPVIVRFPTGTNTRTPLSGMEK